MTFYGGGSIVGSFVGGWLADKYNAKKIVVWSLFISASLLLLILAATSKIQLAAIIFSYALIADTFRPSNAIAVTYFSSEADRTRSFSLIRLAINLGFTLGPAIGGIIAIHFGYRNLFIIDSLTGIAAAVFLLLKLPDFVRAHVTKEQKKAEGISAYLNVKFLLFIGLVFFYGLTFFQLIFTMPVYFNKIDKYPEDKVGWLLALNGFIVVVLEMPIVTKLSRYKNPMRFIALGCACLALAFSSLLLGNGILLVSILFIVLITFSEILAMPFMMNYTIEAAPLARQGQYNALYSIAYGAAFIFAPMVGLQLGGTIGMSSMIYVLMALSLVLTLLFFLFVKSNEVQAK
jgi:predicted MFS family arabinose efflux permease